MKFRYKKQEEEVYAAIISGIISNALSPKKKQKEKGLLERMIEKAVVRQRTIDALRAIGITKLPEEYNKELAYQN